MLSFGYFSFLCLAGSTFILVFYYIFFFSRLIFYKRKHKSVSRFPDLSVIICGKNEAPNWEKNIPGLLRQEYPANIEYIFVDDESSDGTAMVLKAFAQSDCRVKVVKTVRSPGDLPGKKFPLTKGIEAATHEILLLTDADCRPASPYWIQEMVAAYDEKTAIILGYGAYEKGKDLLNKIIRYETFHTAIQYFSYAISGVPYMGVGRNLSYRKELFEKNNGFRDIGQVPGGDDDLFIRKAADKFNTKIAIDPRAHTVSLPEPSWRNWIKQKNRHYGPSKYYKPIHKILLGLYSLSHFLFYIFFVSTLLFFSWKAACLLFLAKLLAQVLVFSGVLRKLNETDLVKWLPLLDLWMVLHYIIFAPALVKKPAKKWK